MLAVDTNVVVRLLVSDAQTAAAKAVFARDTIFISDTVLLETEWVLRSVYGFEGAEIARGLTDVVGLSQVQLESPDLVGFAISALKRGLDFADAMHLGAARNCEAFISFDRKLARDSAGWASPVVRAP